MTEDTDATTVGHGPADDRAGRGAGVPGPADGLVTADVVTLRDALVNEMHVSVATLQKLTWLPDGVGLWHDYRDRLDALIAAVLADATRAEREAWKQTHRDAVEANMALSERLRAAEAEVAGLRAALTHAEKNLGVIALTLTDHPEYPMKDADIRAARSLAGFTTQDIRAALAAQPAAPEAERERCADCGESKHKRSTVGCLRYHEYECRCVAAPEAEPERCEGYDLSDRPDLAPNIVCTLPAGHDGFHLWPTAQPAAPEAEAERCAFPGCFEPDKPDGAVHQREAGQWAYSGICHPFSLTPR